MRTRSPLDPLRNRMTLAGLATIAGAALAGGGIDRALALADVAGPVRFAASTTVLVAVLTLPLVLALERWVLRPLEALDAISQRHPVALNRSGLPVELRHALARQEETLATLEQTNARLEATVQRRTAALQAVVRADDALVSAGDAQLPDRLLDALRGVSGSGHGALLLQAGPQAALHIDGAPPIHPAAQRALEERLRQQLRVDADLPVRWHATAPGARRGASDRMQVLLRSSGPSGEAAVLLLGTDSPALRISVGAAQAVTRTIARHLEARVQERAHAAR